MNQRERFIRICKCEKVDRPPYWETLGFWDETVKRWRDEGLPSDIEPQDYFQMDRRDYLPLEIGGYVNLPFVPKFDRDIIREDKETVTYRSEEGIIKKERKDDALLSMPQFLEFPVKGRNDFEEIKRRLDPNTKQRYVDWDKLRKEYANRDYPLGFRICGAYGMPRNLMGEENLSYMYYDDPEFIHQIQQHWLTFYKGICSQVLSEIEIDYVFIWEDMAFKTGPLISPKLFKEFMSPYYKELIDHIKGCGVDTVMVDSDGDNRVILPLFLEAGVNAFMPLEIAANMEPVSLCKEYNGKIMFWGGIDKRKLSKDFKTIEEELRSKVPWLLKMGGYIPGLDHSTPPDIPFENYKYYIRLLRELEHDVLNS